MRSVLPTTYSVVALRSLGRGCRSPNCSRNRRLDGSWVGWGVAADREPRLNRGTRPADVRGRQSDLDPRDVGAPVGSMPCGQSIRPHSGFLSHYCPSKNTQFCDLSIATAERRSLRCEVKSAFSQGQVSRLASIAIVWRLRSSGLRRAMMEAKNATGDLQGLLSGRQWEDLIPKPHNQLPKLFLVRWDVVLCSNAGRSIR